MEAGRGQGHQSAFHPDTLTYLGHHAVSLKGLSKEARDAF